MTHGQQYFIGGVPPTNGEILGHIIIMAIAVIAMAVLLVSMSQADARDRQEIHPDDWIRIPRNYLQR